MTQQEANALMHHYIGQPSIQSFGSIELGEEKIITGVDTDIMMAGKHSLKIVPILTAEIDMNPEDAFLIVKNSSYERHEVFDAIMDGAWISFKVVYTNSNRRVWTKSYTVSNLGPGAISAAMHLGYDVFGLIEAGYAIDKKTRQKIAA